jgi:hypothetical protein
MTRQWRFQFVQEFHLVQFCLDPRLAPKLFQPGLVRGSELIFYIGGCGIFNQSLKDHRHVIGHSVTQDAVPEVSALLFEIQLPTHSLHFIPSRLRPEG